MTLGGCDLAPTDAALTADLAALVENGYAAGLIEVRRVERLDNRALTALGRERREVAFAAELQLKRDHDFGTWDQANAATLNYLLGTRPEALEGLTAGGNRAGDAISLTGELIYGRSDQGWKLEGAKAVPLPPPLTSATRERWELLEQWRDFTAVTFRALLAPPGEIAPDLSAAARFARARIAQRDGGLAIASGPDGSDYWRVAQAIADPAGSGTGAVGQTATAESKRTVTNLATEGARENLRLLRDGIVTAAVLRSDEAALAADGEGPFGLEGTFPGLRALASLFPEQVHVVVLDTSPVTSVADLFGLRVAVAGGGPAASLEASDVLRAHRVASAPPSPAVGAPTPANALAALARGESDAVILTAAAPSAALRNFAANHAIRLLPLDADAVALMTTGKSSYAAMLVPARTYAGQDRPIATVGVIAVLVSTEAVPAPDAEALLSATFAEIDFMRLGSPFSAMVKTSTAQRGLTLPLHGGAATFYGPAPGPKPTTRQK